MNSRNLNTLYAPRGTNTNATCISFGIDFVDGGTYFINSNLNDSFATVSQFEDCQDDLAMVLLIDGHTSDQYQCESLPTVPDGKSQLSPCPIRKNQLNTGNWSLLIIGNNAGGHPFAYERDFYLDVAPQQTVTQAQTVTYCETATPTAQSMGGMTVPNKNTISKPATTDLVTITPTYATTTKTKTYTRTFQRWTPTRSIDTVTVTPSCEVPLRLLQPDPACRIVPTIVPVPSGLGIDSSPSVGSLYRRKSSPKRHLDTCPNSSSVPATQTIRRRSIDRRAADEPSITVDAESPVSTTITQTASPTTEHHTKVSTRTLRSALPPQIAKVGTQSVTLTAPTSTHTIYTSSYRRIYLTRTLTASWTYTTVTTPTAVYSSCRGAGGYLVDKRS
ncbi:hypothetical protein K431DRAFT_268431 [Polychaeton citri CBS 116435]|uniref:Uncharacterized protein n=1 Tax=Polychaeton citri CBS 116435 TaxID=1314669 RepID=A0A9P4Q6Q6_9PEZI|nr:hypothetical protein K431DRAFT_268431 [Polychaeton citri CBS 116435]